MYAGILTCVCVGAWRGQRLKLGVFLYRSMVILVSTNLARLAGPPALGICPSYLPRAGVAGACQHTWLFKRESKLRPSCLCCKCLLAEPSPQPWPLVISAPHHSELEMCVWRSHRCWKRFSSSGEGWNAGPSGFLWRMTVTWEHSRRHKGNKGLVTQEGLGYHSWCIRLKDCMLKWMGAVDRYQHSREQRA